MPTIKAFKGIRYNQDKIEKVSDVVCQPYDQISNKMERDYKNRSPYNFVRLVLTKYAEGHDRQREYRDAKKYIDGWMAENIFLTDEKASLYSYWQEFKIEKKTYVRKAFICVVQLEELGQGNILPHEKTLSKPKADRLNLLRITKKDLEPVFLLYTDHEHKVDAYLEKACTDKPLTEVDDDNNVNHKLWQIDNKDIIDRVAAELKDSIFVIADGHHRYETAFNYSNELGLTDKDHPANYKLIALVNIEDPGLVILPTHRLIMGLDDFNLVQFLEKTERYFNITKTDREHLMPALAEAGELAFGYYSPQTAYILTLRSAKSMNERLPDRSKEYRNLDVVILHTLLIEDVLGISPENIEDHVRYERSVTTTMKRVDTGEYQFAFFMNPTKPEQVRDIAQKKERMPQKSTDFYPKLISGLVFYDLG